MNKTLTAVVSRITGSSLFRSAGVYTVTSMVNKGIPFLMLPILTRYLTPADYGIVTMFSVLLAWLGMFAGLGTLNGVSIRFFDREEIDFPGYIANCIFILIASSLVLLAIIWPMAEYISTITKFPSSWVLSALGVAVATFLTNLLTNIWQSAVKPFLCGLFQIGMTTLNLGLSLWFIVGLNMNWQGRLWGQIITAASFALLAMVILARSGMFHWVVNKEYLQNALYIGVPMIPHSISGILMDSTDRLMITNMLGVADAGVYVVGVQIGMVIMMFTSSFNTAYFPWLFEKLRLNDQAMKRKIVLFTYGYDVILLLAALSMALVAPWLFSFFVGKNFSGGSSYVVWIALGYAFNGMYMMVTNYIFYAQKTYLLAWISFGTALLNLPLCYLLIRMNGAVGAAQATMTANLVSFLLTWYLSARVHSMPWGLAALRERNGV